MDDFSLKCFGVGDGTASIDVRVEGCSGSITGLPGTGQVTIYAPGDDAEALEPIPPGQLRLQPNQRGNEPGWKADECEYAECVHVDDASATLANELLMDATAPVVFRQAAPSEEREQPVRAPLGQSVEGRAVLQVDDDSRPVLRHAKHLAERGSTGVGPGSPLCSRSTRSRGSGPGSGTRSSPRRSW